MTEPRKKKQAQQTMLELQDLQAVLLERAPKFPGAGVKKQYPLTKSLLAKQKAKEHHPMPSQLTAEKLLNLSKKQSLTDKQRKRLTKALEAMDPRLRQELLKTYPAASTFL
jgi:hypothetical protein